MCGKTGTLAAMTTNITRKRRAKFGVFWILLTLFTAGLGLLLYLIWPRHDEVVSVDRYLQCSACGARV